MTLTGKEDMTRDEAAEDTLQRADRKWRGWFETMHTQNTEGNQSFLLVLLRAEEQGGGRVRR